jgi:hypothetical protein
MRPTNRETIERGETMLHQDFGLSGERMVQMRTEVEHNRLEARLATARLSNKGAGLEEAVPRKGMAARSAAVLMALFR